MSGQKLLLINTAGVEKVPKGTLDKEDKEGAKADQVLKELQEEME